MLRRLGAGPDGLGDVRGPAGLAHGYARAHCGGAQDRRNRGASALGMEGAATGGLRTGPAGLSRSHRRRARVADVKWWRGGAGTTLMAAPLVVESVIVSRTQSPTSYASPLSPPCRPLRGGRRRNVRRLLKLSPVLSPCRRW
jgi:hypothetical protein